MARRQKGKSKKRLRSWHHLPNQDRIYRRNAAKLDAALKGDDDGIDTGPDTHRERDDANGRRGRTSGDRSGREESH